MLFRNLASARGVRLGAAIILTAMSAIVAEDFPALGLALFCVGFGGAIYQGIHLFRERRDRYDLSLLWEKPPDEPEPDDKERWSLAFIVPHGDRYFLFNEQGDLIIAKLSPKGYEEIDRAHVIDPTNTMAGRGRLVVWMHPAFADKCVFVRNDKELICVSLAK